MQTAGPIKVITNRPHAEVECHGAVLPVTQKSHHDADSDLDSLGSATVVEINGGPGVACLECGEKNINVLEYCSG